MTRFESWLLAFLVSAPIACRDEVEASPYDYERDCWLEPIVVGDSPTRAGCPAAEFTAVDNSGRCFRFFACGADGFRTIGPAEQRANCPGSPYCSECSATLCPPSAIGAGGSSAPTATGFGVGGSTAPPPVVTSLDAAPAAIACADVGRRHAIDAKTCELQGVDAIPEGDRERLNIKTLGDAGSDIGRVEDRQACLEDPGWYDSGAASPIPTLCPQSCAEQVSVLLFVGCPSRWR